MLDQRPQDFAGELTDFDANALGLRVKLRPLGEASDRRVEEPKQVARRTVMDIRPDSATITPPWLRQFSSLP
jgi:hypothetical protein